MLGEQPGFLQQHGIQALQVHLVGSAAAHGDIGQRRGAHGAGHGVGHVGVGLKTALGDARPNSGQDVGGVAAIDIRHLLHRAGGNALGGARPAAWAAAMTFRTGS